MSLNGDCSWAEYYWRRRLGMAEAAQEDELVHVLETKRIMDEGNEPFHLQ